MRFNSILLPSLILAYTAIAQTPSAPPTRAAAANLLPSTLLPKDSPHLYRLFFYFQKDFGSWVDQQKAGQTLAASQKIDQDVSRAFGVSIADYAQVKSLSDTAWNQLHAIDEEERVHANTRARFEVPPLSSALRDFEARRLDIVNRHIALLQRQLSAASWSSFQVYINGTHRNMYAVVPVKLR